MPGCAFRLRSSAVVAPLVLAAALAGCKLGGASAVKDATPSSAPGAGPTGSPSLCAAIRGNGNLIFAHFGALARILEDYGMIEGTAGGSSGSITQFLYESVYINSELRSCDGRACSPAETGARAALLMKSLQGYLSFLTEDTDESVAIKNLLPVVARLKAQGVTDALVAAGDPTVVAALKTVLSSADLRDLVNPELLGLLTTAASPTYAAQQIWASIQVLVNLQGADPVVFYRPGLLNFKTLARLLGRIGTFYAAYAPVDKPKMRTFLNACAMDSVGMSWTALKDDPKVGGGKCGSLFQDLVTPFRKTLLANEAQYHSRADDDVGQFLPMLVSTSILQGAPAVQAYEAARKNFLANAPSPFGFSLDFGETAATPATLSPPCQSAVCFGYWGRPGDLDTVAANARGYADPKTKKFEKLGQVKWGVALSLSPAEPSLSRIQELSDTQASAGGWSDLHPVLALRNLGCQKVVYVTRQGDESTFAQGVATNLGASPQQLAALYSLDDPAPQAGADPRQAKLSSFELSLAEADGVWCTNWNHFDTPQIDAISADAYNAPFELHRDGIPAVGPAYANARANVGLRGCSLGAPAVAAANQPAGASPPAATPASATETQTAPAGSPAPTVPDDGSEGN